MIAVHDDIERVIQGGQLDKAERTLEGLDASDETRADLLFLKGLLAEARLDWMGAHELYAQVLEIAPDLLARPGFRMAFVCSIAASRHDCRSLEVPAAPLDGRAIARELEPMLRRTAAGGVPDRDELM